MEQVQLIPILSDNYVFILSNSKGEALLVDPGEALKPLEVIKKQGLQLKGILATHHHADHIGGIREILQHWKVPVYAPEKNREQITATRYVHNNETFEIAGFKINTISLPGHTLGITAYWLPEEKWLFSGDVLFGLGCGRLFEGSFEQGFESLQKIKTLDPETKIFCTHEYTSHNLRFCKTLNTNNEQLTQYENKLKIPSVPLTLKNELLANPFLRAKNAAEFKKLRELRNQF